MFPRLNTFDTSQLSLVEVPPPSTMEHLIPYERYFDPNFVSHFPMKLYNSLIYLGASKTRLTLLANGNYKLSPTSSVPLGIFLFFQGIFWTKTIHLAGILLHLTGIDASEFYDQIAVLTWFLILTGCGVAYWGLVSTYPLFEILKEGWRLQNRIFKRFQHSDIQDFQGQVTKAGKWVLARQLEILIVCLISISIQFFSYPKYLTNIYILFPGESDLLFWINYVYEFLCMFIIVILWNCALSGFPLSAIYLEQTLRLMNSKILQENFQDDRMRPSTISTVHSDNIIKSKSSRSSRKLSRLGSNFAFSSSLSRDDLSSAGESRGQGSPTYEYSISKATRDYRYLLLYSTLMNEFQRNKLLSIHTCLFGQQTAEAFTAFRMLREPGIALSDFAFLLTDMWTAIRQLFLNFKGISFVGIAAEEFLHGLRLRVNSLNDRRYYSRVLKSFPTIHIKQGPNLCKRDLLGNAWMIMMNYYVTAALWP